MELLRKDENSYFITSKRPFSAIAVISNEDIGECFDFAYGMTFGASGQHRDHRSGGRHFRKNGEVFINTFQGKVAEYGFYRYLTSEGVESKPPDISQSALGIWDNYDLLIGPHKVNVKSTKSYGNLLLLETKDWNNSAQYIPNLKSGSHAKYDLFVLLRLSPDGEKLMKSKRLFYTNSVDRDALMRLIAGETWTLDIAGGATSEMVKKMITSGMILPQRALLNGRVEMDAENYYIQAGSMMSPDEIIDALR